MFHRAQSLLNICLQSDINNQLELYSQFFIAHRLLLTWLYANLRRKKFLEGGEDAAVRYNHRRVDFYLLLTFPHFHTCQQEVSGHFPVEHL